MSARVVLAPLLLALLTSGAGCAQLREELRNNFRMMGPLPSYKFATRIPVFHEERLPNGLTLIVHEAPYLPLCAVRLELRAGAAAVPTAQAGLPALTYSALQAAATRPRDGAGLDALGIPLDLTVDHEGAAFSLVAGSAALPEALQRLARALTTPPAAVHIEEARASRRERALREAHTPTGAGQATLRRLLYGADHPLGLPTHGDPAVLARLPAADVAAFQRRALQPQQAALVLVGRVTIAEARRLAQQAFTGLPTPPSGAPADADPLVAPPLKPPSRPGVYLVPWPGLSQTTLIAGRLLPLLPRARVMPIRRGLGQISGNLFHELRSERGVTYDTAGGLHVGRRGAAYVLQLSVQNDAAKRSLQATRSTLLDASDNRGAFGHMDSEWGEKAMYRLRASLALDVVYRFEGIEETAQAAGLLFQRGWPLTSHQDELMQAQELKGGTISESTYGLYDREDFRFVLVGDPDQIRRQLPGEDLQTP